jgi:hypothetical protein
MKDRNDVETRAFERSADQAEQVFERKLAIFRDDPYSYCEANLAAFGIYDLLGVALEALLFDFDESLDFKASPCARADTFAAIRDSIEKVEL